MLAQVVAQRVALSVVRSVAVWCERVFALSEVQEQMRVALGDDSAAASVCQTHEVRLKLERLVDVATVTHRLSRQP